MSQLSRSAPHTGTQAPIMQVVEVVPVGLRHARPPMPQFMLSVCMLTETLPQKVCPMGHWQTPVTHVRPPVQVVVQLPQCALSVCVFTHEPLHSVSPPVHMQFPPWQLCPMGQAALQAPQFW